MNTTDWWCSEEATVVVLQIQYQEDATWNFHWLMIQISWPNTLLTKLLHSLNTQVSILQETRCQSAVKLQVTRRSSPTMCTCCISLCQKEIVLQRSSSQSSVISFQTIVAFRFIQLTDFFPDMSTFYRKPILVNKRSFPMFRKWWLFLTSREREQRYFSSLLLRRLRWFVTKGVRNEVDSHVPLMKHLETARENVTTAMKFWKLLLYYCIMKLRILLKVRASQHPDKISWPVQYFWFDQRLLPGMLFQIRTFEYNKGVTSIRVPSFYGQATIYGVVVKQTGVNSNVQEAAYVSAPVYPCTFSPSGSGDNCDHLGTFSFCSSFISSFGWSNIVWTFECAWP